ncbi:MAG TPA: FtsX-like permease family protein [Micromonosporaceae bacterium]|nr:FtsX-like permease family protein [Micromonosporaceae bacterium]
MFRVWRMAPWIRAPFLLLRRPGVATALIAASFVATLPAAAAAPFLSSSANATLHSQIRQACPTSVGDLVTYDMHLYSPTDYQSPWGYLQSTSLADEFSSDQATEAQLADVARTGGGLAAPETAWYATNAKVAVGGAGAKVTSMTIPDFQDHVTTVAGPSGSGVWIPDGFASAYHLGVGDPLVYTSLWGPPTKLRVAAVYRDVRGDPNNPAFCALHTLIFGPFGAQLLNDAIPPVVLMDRQTFMSGVIPYHGKTTMMFALDDPTVPIERTAGVVDTIKSVNTAANTSFSQCPDCVSTSSDLSAFAVRSQLARTGIKPTVFPITAAGVLVGLVVVAAAAIFWVLRRRRELTVLSAHGMGGFSLGIKGLLEALPALLTGAALAWVGAWWLVRTAGPDPEISHASIIDSLWSALAALGAAMIVVLIAAAVRCRTLTDERHARRGVRLARWPWELLLIAAGVWAAVGFGSATVTRGALGGDGGIVVQVPARLLIVPLLVTVGCLTLLGRIVMFMLRSRRTRPAGDNGSTRRRSMVWFLGWRRVVREAAVVAVLAGATALPIALATYGDTVTRSVQATVDGEAQLLVGTDVVVTLKQRVPIPAEFRGNSTEVLRLTGVTLAGNGVNLYAVDPDEFSKVAFWNNHIDGQSLASVLAPLSKEHQPGTPYPAITSGNIPTGIQAPSWGFPTDTKYDVQFVKTLPAEQGGYKSLIVTPASLGTEINQAVPQLWIRGEPNKIMATLATLDLPAVSTANVDAVYPNTVFQPLTYTFEYLTALSILTGVVTVVGLLLYVEAQAPGHRRGYVMARRMGMRSGTHRRALLLELALPLLAGLGIGLAVALGLTYGFASGFDVDPTLPPNTLITLPAAVIAGISVAVGVVALIASAFAQVRVARANPSEVLRDTV